MFSVCFLLSWRLHRLTVFSLDCPEGLKSPSVSQEHKEEVTCVSFNANDSSIASGSTSGDLVLHSLTTNVSSKAFGHGSNQVRPSVSLEKNKLFSTLLGVLEIHKLSQYCCSCLCVDMLVYTVSFTWKCPQWKRKRTADILPEYWTALNALL